MQKVTAVILNYNSGTDCKKCIDFLQKQDYENLSILVVDNASANLEKKKIQDICSDKHVDLILNSKNTGFSAGNNIGLRVAVQDGAQWMLVINPDVEIRDPGYISYVMEQLPKWPEAAVVGTNILLSNGKRQNPSRNLTEREEVFCLLEPILRKLKLQKDELCPDVTGYCEKLAGCCFFILKDFLIKSDYLDESVFMYCEEPILSKRVKKYGYKELYLREKTAYHIHHINKDKHENIRKRMDLFCQSRLYYIEHYSGYRKIFKRTAISGRKLQARIWSCMR